MVTFSDLMVILDCENYEATQENDSSPVLVVHGMLGSKKNWHTFCKSCNEKTGKQIIAVDCRNHGQSPRSDHMSYPVMAGDIAETFQEMMISKCILIGHSMGGKVVMESALSMPNIIEKLILVDITPISASTKLGTVSVVPMVLSAMTNLDLSKVKNRQDADKMLAETIPFDGLRAWALTNLYKDDKGQFQWQHNLNNIQDNVDSLFSGVALNEREPYMGETLFVGGGESDVLRNVDMNEMRKMFPNARLEMIPGAGHFVHTDKPKEFLEIVRDFLG
ncbi:protein ABHD11-like isoform X2 [Dendronephthya gigantea]|uniref:protein ABHD11-like isoform X2 n=1 Tax=Dendronephthya gigantea TaxID=151771 RepID=UPI00106D4C87|nr:protein ABHD11-like isoform X2 [Dendronephthya gigantea]XP_028396583.1 protein ABHD11-like isoform X2 [Dendronephthya gigantea]